MKIIERTVLMEAMQKVGGSEAKVAKKLNPKKPLSTKPVKPEMPVEESAVGAAEKTGRAKGAPIVKRAIDAYGRATAGNLKTSVAGAAEEVASPMVQQAKASVTTGKMVKPPKVTDAQGIKLC